MSDDDIFPPDFGDQLIYTPDNRRRRVQAKAELWEYCLSAFDDFIAIQDPTEATELIMYETIRKLHPWFTFTEIMKEMESIFKTFELKYLDNWSDTYVQQITDRADSIMKNRRDNQNPFNSFLDDLPS
ncbi:MAG: hypothetical protein ACTHLE_03600 [Agriterribacter sp.]